MTDVLESILLERRKAVQLAREGRSLSELEAEISRQDASRDFFAAVSRDRQVSVIAEMKRRSPSAGEIRNDFDPAMIARDYAAGGAAALSVLTEPARFSGTLEDLTQAREACQLPVLRKDFIFDAYQIAEARAAGADAVLLIAEALTPKELKELVMVARRYSMEPLVEFFLESSIPAVLESGCRLIGINTRNLRTLEMVPNNVMLLATKLPRDRKIVAESGIKSAAEVESLSHVGVSAILVGESLLRQKDLASAVSQLVKAGEKAGV